MRASLRSLWGAMVGIGLLAVAVGISSTDVRSTADEDDPLSYRRGPLIYDDEIPRYGRKPCPDCEAATIRVDADWSRCQVCGGMNYGRD